MIKSKMLKTLKDFEALSKGDIIAVEWRRDVNVNKSGTKRTCFATYVINDNLSQQTEIILEKTMNIYFNYMMFLNPKEMGVSNAREILLLSSTNL
jgi:hypothetical protein